MKAIDRLVAWFSPETAVRRMAARSALAYYEGAEPSRLRKFHRERGTANQLVRKAAKPLRDQARHLERNHDIVTGALRTFANNVVGAAGVGIEPQPRRLDGTIHQDYADRLLDDLNQQPTTKCLSGLCTKRAGRQDFWNTTSATVLAAGEVKLSDMTKPNVGARYGQYSGATVGDPSDPTKTANPILAETSADNRGGWYWIEVMQYDESAKNSGLIVGGANTDNLLRLNLEPNVVYRITALAYGRKPGTMAVLQQTYVRQVHKGDHPSKLSKT